MIISNDGKIIVCTPTKVGSTSLEEVILVEHELGRRLYRGEAMGNAPGHNRGYKHGAECVFTGKKRLVLVRHPLDRFASIYAFIAKSKGNFFNDLVKYARKGKVDSFCSAYLDSNDTVWTRQLSTYVDKFKPTSVFKLEENGIYKIAMEFGIELEKVPYINRTTHGGWKDLASKMSSEMRKKIVALHCRSIEVLNYV